MHVDYLLVSTDKQPDDEEHCTGKETKKPHATGHEPAANYGTGCRRACVLAALLKGSRDMRAREDNCSKGQ